MADGSHMDREKIIADILNRLTNEEKAALRSVAREADLVRLHFTVGRAIRNAYGLWAGNPSEPLKDPDDVSAELLHEVWKRLK